MEAPLDRDGVDDKSESLSEFLEELEDIEDTFLNFWAVATSSALKVCTLVVERRTGAEIWILSSCLIEFDLVSLFWVGFSLVVSLVFSLVVSLVVVDCDRIEKALAMETMVTRVPI